MSVNQDNYFSKFKKLDEDPTPQTENYFSKFTKLPAEDSLAKKVFRTAYQPFSGIAEISKPGLAMSLWDLLGRSESLQALNELGEDRISELKKKFPSAHWENYQPINEEEYLKNIEKASSTVPTVSNIEKFIEKHTGIPLDAHTFLQKILHAGGMGFHLSPGSLKEKVIKGAATGATKGVLEKSGVPEPIADVASLLPTGISASPISKSSGLPKRWYENIKNPVTLSNSQYKKLTGSIENDVKTLTDNIIQKHNQTAKLKVEDPLLRSTLNDAFEDVTNLAESLPSENLSGETLRKFIVKRVKEKPKIGLTSSAEERSYKSEITRLLKERTLKPSKKLTQETKIIDQYGNPIKKTKIIPSNPISNKKLLEQYRKTNRELTNYFDPSKSKGINIGKRDALLDYNRSISDLWETHFPDSEFNKLFKETNKIYSELAELENIDNFFNEIFKEGKINYKKAKQFLDNPSIQKSFKSVLGEPGFNEMKQIFKDFLPTETAMSLIKQGENLGISHIAGYVKRWAISPLWAKFNSFKDMSKIARNSLLSNQQFMLTWRTAIKDLKSKNFEKAVMGFKKLDKMSEDVSTNRFYHKTNPE